MINQIFMAAIFHPDFALSIRFSNIGMEQTKAAAIMIHSVFFMKYSMEKTMSFSPPNPNMVAIYCMENPKSSALKRTQPKRTTSNV